MTKEEAKQKIAELVEKYHKLTPKEIKGFNEEARTAWLESQGFRVIRFWNNEVHSNLDGVITRITEALQN